MDRPRERHGKKPERHGEELGRTGMASPFTRYVALSGMLNHFHGRNAENGGSDRDSLLDPTPARLLGASFWTRPPLWPIKT